MKPIVICTLFATLPTALGANNYIFSDDSSTPQKKLIMGDPTTDKPSSGASGDGPREQQTTVILSDVMSRDKSISIFASLSRQVESAEQRLDDEARNTTVLAPLNSAVEALPRKPWEDPEDDYKGDKVSEQKYAGQDGFEQAQRNLQRFVEAHMIIKSPWPEGERCRAVGEEDDGREVWWEEKEGKRLVSCCPGGLVCGWMEKTLC
jgi:hypothetical protein